LRNNDLHNITQKAKYRTTRTPVKTGVSSYAQEGQAVVAPDMTKAPR